MQFTVNKNIKRIIREKGLDVREVAAKAKLPEVILQSIIECACEPSDDEIVDLAAALRTPLAELFRVPECRACKRWTRFYTKTSAGLFVEADYGLCVKQGFQGVREPRKVCEDFCTMKGLTEEEIMEALVPTHSGAWEE